MSPTSVSGIVDFISAGDVVAGILAVASLYLVVVVTYAGCRMVIAMITGSDRVQYSRRDYLIAEHRTARQLGQKFTYRRK